jgi:copper chaperone CopZ
MVEMIVPMDCAGCESKIKKALHKLDGNFNFYFLFEKFYSIFG